LHEVLLLTTELVNNALWHGRGEAWLDVEVEPGLVNVGVRDSGGGPVERAQEFSWPEAGHGLRIIEAMSDEWGIQPLPDGKRVWFKLSWRPSVLDSQRYEAHHAG
jgi:anti-sigma regulatory factor (Ser/Thr protein kinase)